jgi:hypothetical protein
MNGTIFKTLKKRACFARFSTLSTYLYEDKKINQIERLTSIFSITKEYVTFQSLLHIVQCEETI